MLFFLNFMLLMEVKFVLKVLVSYLLMWLVFVVKKVMFSGMFVMVYMLVVCRFCIVMVVFGMNSVL